MLFLGGKLTLHRERRRHVMLAARDRALQLWNWVGSTRSSTRAHNNIKVKEKATDTTTTPRSFFSIFPFFFLSLSFPGVGKREERARGVGLRGRCG